MNSKRKSLREGIVRREAIKKKKEHMPLRPARATTAPMKPRRQQATREGG
jgi:hypothetical protein